MLRLLLVPLALLATLSACGGGSKTTDATMAVDAPNYTGSSVVTIKRTELKTSGGNPVTGNSVINLPYKSSAYAVHSGDVVNVSVDVPRPKVGPNTAIAVQSLECSITVGGKEVKSNTGPARCSASYTVP